MGTTLRLYRGEKMDRWPPPELRLMRGMMVRTPWVDPFSVSLLWEKLKTEVNGQPGASPKQKAAAYAEKLRAMGHDFALATAWTSEGSFTSDYDYVIEIENAHLFAWGENEGRPDLGGELELTGPNQVKVDFIVLDNTTVEKSKILGFGHNTGTREITFFSDLPTNLIESCNGKKITDYAIKSIQDWTDMEERIKYRFLLR